MVVTDRRIEICLMFDTVYSACLFMYCIFCVSRLIIFAWNYGRLEARKHLTYFITVSLSLGLSLPLIIADLLVFMNKTNMYGDIRLTYYSDNIAKALPCAFYLLMKPAEDCFSCFNRLAPQSYSVIQFS